ncbi:MAG: DUF3598 family protein [Leptolyngbyaceae cyanobacterium RM2_2_4]|nr:DUF3598 family protein [Leptolyngbyaceae cyanobacterium RM2_2_4]
MNNLDKNWDNLFGEYTTDETVWCGQWVTYSPDQKVTKSQRVIRSFRSNADNTVITHINRYIDASENVEEKTWQIDRETCNKSDGVVHPARPWMRALAIGANATAWTSQQLIPETPFGAQLSFKEGSWGTSAAIMYGENGQLHQILYIREHLGRFSDEALSLETLKISGNWMGKKRSMTPDLSISPEEDMQLSFEQMGDRYKKISLPSNLILVLSERVNADQPIQIAVGQQTANHELKYLEAHYTTAGAFALLVSATLQS